MIVAEDQEFIAAKIYKHFGRPDGIAHEKLRIYEKWNCGNICRGRLSYIHNEIVYSYFLREKDGLISVHVNTRAGKEPELIIDNTKKLKKPVKVAK